MPTYLTDSFQGQIILRRGLSLGVNHGFSYLCHRTGVGAKCLNGRLESSQWRTRYASANDRTNRRIPRRNGGVDVRHVFALHDSADIDAERHALEVARRNQK